MEVKSERSDQATKGQATEGASRNHRLHLGNPVGLTGLHRECVSRDDRGRPVVHNGLASLGGRPTSCTTTTTGSGGQNSATCVLRQDSGISRATGHAVLGPRERRGRPPASFRASGTTITHASGQGASASSRTDPNK